MPGHCSSHSVGSRPQDALGLECPNGVMSGTPMPEGRQMQTHLE